MHPVQFGFCLPIFAMPGSRLFRTPNYERLDAATTMKMAYAAETLGYDALWVADHLMLGRDQAILEGWTVLSALAGSTQRARLGLIHQAHFFRNPALAAKMGATLDQISGGRFIYFIDGSFGRQEHLAYHLPWYDAVEERTCHVVDGLQITLALWQSDRPVSIQGQFYQVENAICAPKPVQKPHPPVWFGEANPANLDACARYGQGWNTTPVTLAELQRRLQALAAACQTAGRSVDELERSLEIQILIAPDRETLRARLQEMIARSTEPAELDPSLRAFLAGASDDLPIVLTDTWLVGTPDEVERQVRARVDLGVTHFMLWFVDAPRHDGLELFAQAVAPRFR